MKFIDLHCDTIWMLMRQTHENLKSNSFCVDVDKLRQAESMVQFFACFIYMDGIAGENCWDRGYELALNMIQKGKEEFFKCRDDISLALEFKDVVGNKENGKISAFLTVEEGGILNGHLDRLDQLHGEGVRLVTLTWNRENCIGFPNSRETNTMQKGLKPFGIEVVEHMNDLGMLIDVSHLSDGGFWDVLRHSKKPIVASHSNARSLCNHPRNLTDEMIRAVAECGGIIGTNLYPYFIQENGKATVETIGDHISYMYKIGGEDVLAIGTDFDGFDEGELELTHIGEMGKLYEEVKKRGFSERQMEKIWSGNALRILKG